MITMEEIYRTITSNFNDSILLGIVDVGTIPLMDGYKQEYAKKHNIYDFDLYLKYKSFYYIGDSIEDFRKSVNCMLSINNYKYTTLYNTTVLSYNPIENYDRTETFVRTYDAYTDSTEINIGAQENSKTEVFGASSSTTTEEIGGVIDNVTTKLGNRTDTNETTDGQRVDVTNTTTGDTAVNNTGFAFDNETGYDVSKSQTTHGTDSIELTKGSQTNSSTIVKGAETDETTQTYGTRNNQEKVENSEKSNSFAENTGTRQDSSTNIYGNRKEQENNTIHGNIGVMSTQQMIEQERQVALFSLYDIIFCDLVYNYFILMEEGE